MAIAMRGLEVKQQYEALIGVRSHIRWFRTYQIP